jgi:DNA-binding MarR family transcriptional regulator
MTVNLTRPPARQSFLSEEELDRSVELIFAGSRQFWRAAEGPLQARQLGPAHYRALAAIRRAEHLPVSALRNTLGVRKQSLARVLRDLQVAGFIERAPGEEDRRQRLIALTAAGRAAESDASDALRARLAHVFRGVGEEAVSGMNEVLAILAEPPADRE